MGQQEILSSILLLRPPLFFLGRVEIKHFLKFVFLYSRICEGEMAKEQVIACHDDYRCAQVD